MPARTLPADPSGGGRSSRSCCGWIERTRGSTDSSVSSPGGQSNLIGAPSAAMHAADGGRVMPHGSKRAVIGAAARWPAPPSTRGVPTAAGPRAATSGPAPPSRTSRRWPASRSRAVRPSPLASGPDAAGVTRTRAAPWMVPPRSAGRAAPRWRLRWWDGKPAAAVMAHRLDPMASSPGHRPEGQAPAVGELSYEPGCCQWPLASCSASSCRRSHSTTGNPGGTLAPLGHPRLPTRADPLMTPWSRYVDHFGGAAHQRDGRPKWHRASCFLFPIDHQLCEGGVAEGGGAPPSPSSNYVRN